jgi:exodeoxyribonuclease VII small subunit
VFARPRGAAIQRHSRATEHVVPNPGVVMIEVPAELTFEGALERLGEIVEQLEGDGLELDESLALFEEGVRLLRRAESTLEGAGERIRLLVEEGDGFALQEFEGDR